MMKNRLLALGLITLAITPTIMHAEDCCMPAYRPGEPLCNGCAGYSPYAGIQLDCGWDVYAAGEFLYWKPFTGAPYNSVLFPPSVVLGTPPFAPEFMLSEKFHYRPGFRVEVGMTSSCFDHWMFSLAYTRYHHSFSKTYNAEFPNTLTSTVAMFSDAFLFSSIRNMALFHFDIVDLCLQRSNYLGRRVILNPSMGLKWLKRTYKIGQELTQLQVVPGPVPLIDSTSATLKFSEIGPSAGFDGSWLMCWGFKLIGKVDVALLYPYHRSFVNVITPALITPATPVVREKTHIRHLDIFALGGMGLEWGSYFCCNRFHFNLAATYDFAGSVVKLDFLSGDIASASVSLMGLTIRGQFDF